MKKKSSITARNTIIVALLTRKEVADQLGICTHTVARWERAGRIKGVRLSERAIRYRPEDVDQLVADALV